MEGARFLPLIQVEHFLVQEDVSTDIDGVVLRKDLDRVIGIVVVPVEGTEVYREIDLRECLAERLDRSLGSVEVLCLK